MSERGNKVTEEIAASRAPPPARAFLGVGSNLQPRKNVIRALQMLAASEGVSLAGISTFFKTPALPPPERPRSQDPAVVRENPSSGSSQPGESSPFPGETGYPDFLNGVVEIRTSLNEREVSELLGQIEEALGRVRLPDPFGPRTMDLDLLLYLPEGRDAHPDIFSRPWVARPLHELDPELRLPPEGRPLAEVAATFPDPGGKAEASLTEDLRSRFLTQ